LGKTCAADSDCALGNCVDGLCCDKGKTACSGCNACANSLTGRYEVASVPLIIVNGTYTTSVSQAGNEAKLLSLINDLAAREKGR